MEKIFAAFADRKGVSASALRFTLDGNRIDKSQTPKMVGTIEQLNHWSNIDDDVVA